MGRSVMEAVLVALITTLFPLILRSNRNAKRANEHAQEARDIVRGNGHGTVTALGERIEAKLVSMEGKIDDALSWQGRHEAQHRRKASSGLRSK